MAGISLGVTSSPVPSSGVALQRSPHSNLTATRKRRTHGVCMLGTDLATVYSSRSQADELGVTLALGNASLSLTSGMTPDQARAVARALHAAAMAAESTQQRGAVSSVSMAAKGGAA